MHLKHTSKLKAELVCSFRKKICSSSTLHLSYCRSVLSFSFELPFKLSTTGASHFGVGVKLSYVFCQALNAEG